MSSAQRNYPVHEQELLGRRDDAKTPRSRFTWVTDYKVLEHVLTQKSLTVDKCAREQSWLFCKVHS